LADIGLIISKDMLFCHKYIKIINFLAVYSESGKDSGSIIRQFRLTNQILAVNKTLVQQMILAAQLKSTN
jgi:hypothetical protein